MKTKPGKVPLRKLLVDRDLCSDEQEADRWVMAGKVIVNDTRVDKPGTRVPADARVYIKGLRQYVGRGGTKLEGALKDLEVSVTDQTVLDAGASTGGFTDCLLQHGAKRVYAVDVGYGMLAGRLRSDRRVVVFEKTNISELSPGNLEPRPSLATVDLSYLSLKKAIPILANLLTPDGQMVCLVKPLFEIEDSEARRTGKISDGAGYNELLCNLLRFVEENGFEATRLVKSRVTGKRGTREFFLLISLTPSGKGRGFNVESIVEETDNGRGDGTEKPLSGTRSPRPRDQPKAG